MEQLEVWVSAGIQLLNLMNTRSSPARPDLETRLSAALDGLSTAAKAPAKAKTKASDKASAKRQAKAYAKAKASTSDRLSINDGFAFSFVECSAAFSIVFQCVAQPAFLHSVEAGLR